MLGAHRSTCSAWNMNMLLRHAGSFHVMLMFVEQNMGSDKVLVC